MMEESGAEVVAAGRGFVLLCRSARAVVGALSLAVVFGESVWPESGPLFLFF